MALIYTVLCIVAMLIAWILAKMLGNWLFATVALVAFCG